jgi:phosphotriesterase-related protein
MRIQTVLGEISADSLGRTLFHEHLIIKYPGAEFDPRAEFDRGAAIAEGTRRLKLLRQVHGVETFVDPCPIELGRDVEAMAEISEKSEVNVVCTTGFYHESIGLPSYWRNSSVEQIAELYITELQNGVMKTGIRAGAIKCATGSPKSRIAS